MSYLHISNVVLVTAVLACEQAPLCEFRGKIILPAEPFSPRDGGSVAKIFPELAQVSLLAGYCWSHENETWRQYSWIMRDSRSLVNTKFPIKVANCIPYFTILQVISNLETQRSYKVTLISRISSYLKNLSSGSQIIYQNVYKTANKSASIHTILLSRNRLKLFPWFFTHVIKNVESTINYEGKLHFKSASI